MKLSLSIILLAFSTILFSQNGGAGWSHFEAAVDTPPGWSPSNTLTDSHSQWAFNLTTREIWFWNGSAWVEQQEHTGTTGSVFFAGSNGKPTQDNANLFWDDTNNRLRINNSTGTYATNILGKIWLDDGQSNVAIGESSGLALTTGVNNTLIGDNAGIALTNNNRNVLIGSNAGKNLTVSNNANGDGIVGIGYGAIENANPVSGTYTAIGAYAGQNNTGGFGWTYVGYKSGQGSSGSNTVFMGYESGQNSTGNDNVGIGYRTLKTAGGQNTAIGTNAGLALTSTASSNTYIGYNSGNNVTTGTSNTGVGLAALSNSSGNFNTGVGGFSGQYNTGTYNSYIGYRSGVGVTAGNYNTIIGSHLRAPTTANRSVLIGNDNGNGTNSGAGSGYDTATDMVVIGNMAAASQLAAGDAGREDEGKQGVIIGYNAAKDPVNTDSSIIIGAHAGVGNDKRNIMLLGYGALADQNGQIVLGTSVGNYTQLKSRNYKFNIDQSVTAANDNHVLTYDNATGEIGLEAVAVTGANNGLQVTSNNVELGSGTNAASGTSADLTSARYIPMNGNDVSFVGTTNGTTAPVVKYFNNGDVSFGGSTVGPNQMVNNSFNYDNSLNSLVLKSGSSVTFSTGSSTNNFYIADNVAFSGPMTKSLLIGDVIRGSGIGGHNIMVGNSYAAQGNYNIFLYSGAVNPTMTTFDRNLLNMSRMVNQGAGYTNWSGNMGVLTDTRGEGFVKNTMLVSNTNFNYLTNVDRLMGVIGTYDVTGVTDTVGYIDNSTEGILLHKSNSQQGKISNTDMFVAIGRTQQLINADSTFNFGNLIQNTGKSNFVINLIPTGITGTTQDWDINNSSSNTVKIAAKTYEFHTSKLSSSGTVGNSGVSLAAGASAWASISDKNKKTNYTTIDNTALLNWFRTKNIEKWQYKAEDGAYHVGFYAQDFHDSPLGKLGQDDKKIETIDGIGMNSALIAALLEKIDELENRIKNLEK